MEDKDKKELEELEEELEKELNQLVAEGLATKEEVEEAKKALRRLDTSKQTKKEKTITKIKGILVCFVTYFILFSACFGLYSAHITFTNKSYPFVFILILTLYEVLIRTNILSSMLKIRFGYLFYIFIIVITAIILYVLNPYLYFVSFNNPTILCGFYFTAEALYLLFNYVMIKRKFRF